MRVVVCRLDEFLPGQRRIVQAGLRSIGVFRVGEEFFAIRNRCPHQGGPLCLGKVSPWAAADGPGKVRMDDSSMLLACPWHGWEYDIRTGQSFMGPGETRVKAYGVTIEQAHQLDDEAKVAKVSDVSPIQGRVPGPYVAETFPVYVDDDYLVVIDVG